jgi:hypothetical protein
MTAYQFQRFLLLHTPGCREVDEEEEAEEEQWASRTAKQWPELAVVVVVVVAAVVVVEQPRCDAVDQERKSCCWGWPE